MLYKLFCFLQWILLKVFNFFDRLFNFIFSSTYNPLYRSGTIAVVLLLIASVTGFILIFFYSLSEPYQSVEALNSQVWFGRWIRAVHRYSSDASVVAVIIHILRMFVQKKVFSSHAFAWISGVILFVLLFLTGWTGFVMVWDQQAQALALGGAALIDSTGLLFDPLSRAFSGEVEQPPASFFFLNLFLHIILPLALIFGIWIHTIKLARSAWFPHRTLLWALVILFSGVGMLWPASLGKEANLLEIASNYPLDLFFNFWLPYTSKNPFLVLIFWVATFLILILVPVFFSKAVKLGKKTSTLDENKCHGCEQCVVDCPYEAISMVERSYGPPMSELVAQVDPLRCVSCGLCAPSCGPMTIGPPGRKGTDQYQLVKAYIQSLKDREEDLSKQTVVIGCQNQPDVLKRIEQEEMKEKNNKVYPVDCMGSLHMSTIGYLAVYFRSVLLAACPARNCTRKDAYFLLQERLSGAREPGLPGRVDPKRVHLIAVGDGEEKKLFRMLKNIKQAPFPWSRYRLKFLPPLGGLVLIVCLAALSRVDFLGTATKVEESGILRLSWRLAGQSIKTCRERSKEELADLPMHMQRALDCTEKKLSYRLLVLIEDQKKVEEVVRPGGLRGDGPLYVAKDIPLSPGEHLVKLRFEALDPNAEVKNYEFEQSLEIKEGRISGIFLKSDQSALFLKEKS